LTGTRRPFEAVLPHRSLLVIVREQTDIFRNERDLSVGVPSPLRCSCS
jgi:hypothetical protein